MAAASATVLVSTLRRGPLTRLHKSKVTLISVEEPRRQNVPQRASPLLAAVIVVGLPELVNYYFVQGSDWPTWL